MSRLVEISSGRNLGQELEHQQGKLIELSKGREQGDVPAIPTFFIGRGAFKLSVISDDLILQESTDYRRTGSYEGNKAYSRQEIRRIRDDNGKQMFEWSSGQSRTQVLLSPVLALVKR